MEELLTAKEAATKLRCTPAFLVKLRKQKVLRAVKLGSRYVRYSASEIDRLVNEYLAYR